MDGWMDGWGDEGMNDKKRASQQKRDSYLHPRQLVYKSSPERRKIKKKAAATVNTCTVKPSTRRETRVYQSKTLNRCKRENKVWKKTVSGATHTQKKRWDERKIYEGREERVKERTRETERARKSKKRENNQKCVKSFIGSQLEVRTHKKLLQKKKRMKTYKDHGWTCLLLQPCF